MVRIDTTRQKLAEAYAALGTYFGLAPDDPGDSATPADEAVGGGYARVATTWSAGAAGVQTGTACVINAAAGAYGYAILCSDANGDNMIDNTKIAGAMLPTDGQIVVTPTYTQS